MQALVSLKNVNKKFYFYPDQERDIKHLLIRAMRFQFGWGPRNEFQVLNDVSFDICPGEFVGIMGRNGAGKSTILELISRIYQPTSGQIEVRGKIAPLLELGAGFSHDLSGYDNIFLNAAILGFGRERTLQSLDSIIEFSELKDKIHLPVKHFSSGMLVRLGFAVAVHLDAPILLFDEVLGVGDAGFQEKCLGKIKSMHQEGRTIVLVTHSPEQVRQHCSRCIIIEQTRKVFDGEVNAGADIYLNTFKQAQPLSSPTISL